MKHNYRILNRLLLLALTISCITDGYVALALDVQTLEETLVVGYGEQEKIFLTGAVSSIGNGEGMKSGKNMHGEMAALATVPYVTSFGAVVSTQADTCRVFACTNNCSATYESNWKIDSGYMLENDGGGPYVNGGHKVQGSIKDGLSLYTDIGYTQTGTYSSTNRALIFDLSQPVPGSVPASVSYGKLKTPGGRFHALYYLNEQTMHITSVDELPVGATVLLERVELWIKLPNGHDAILQFGPWGLGTCSTHLGSVIGGDGTTQASLTRVSQADFHVVAGSGSIGRLWDYHDPANPVDLGLYYFTFSAWTTKVK